MAKNAEKGKKGVGTAATRNTGATGAKKSTCKSQDAKAQKKATRAKTGAAGAKTDAKPARKPSGLDAAAIEEIATFDVILDLPAPEGSSHGITTLYHLRVKEPRACRLDDHSAEAAWRTPEDWAEERVHPFVKRGMAYSR